MFNFEYDEAKINRAIKSMPNPANPEREREYNMHGKGWQELKALPARTLVEGRSLSYSSLKAFHQDPILHLEYLQGRSGPPSYAMEIGKATESFILERMLPKTTSAENSASVAKGTKNHKAWVKAKKDCPDFDLIFERDIATLENLEKNLVAQYPEHVEAMRLGQKQSPVSFTCGETSLPLFGYIDSMSHKTNSVYELKTISPFSDIEKRIKWNPFSIWMQVAIYGMSPFKPEFVHLVFLETSVPNRVMILTFDQDALAKLKRRLVNQVLWSYRKALDIGFYNYAAAKIVKSVTF